MLSTCVAIFYSVNRRYINLPDVTWLIHCNTGNCMLIRDALMTQPSLYRTAQLFLRQDANDEHHVSLDTSQAYINRSVLRTKENGYACSSVLAEM